MKDQLPVLEERFFEKVRIGSKVSPNVSTECWIWTGTKGKTGYGSMKVPRTRRSISSHRASWILHFGLIPTGSLVCHHCDNPSCVRPDHLFLGSHKDNSQDMTRKGRRVAPPVLRGSKCPTSKLSESQVEYIKERTVHGKWGVLSALSREFNVSVQTIWAIKRGINWKSDQ